MTNIAASVLARLKNFARSNGIGNVVLPVQFDVGIGDAMKLTQWRAFLRKNRLDVGGLGLNDIVRSIRAFLLPVS